MRQLFISYARENKPDVEALVRDLDALGYQAWVDSSLRGGQTWWEEILRRIADCDVFLAIVSRHTLNSVACKRELEWALALNKPVLPVAVERLPQALPRTLSMRQIVDYSTPGPEAAFALAGALGNLSTAPSPPKPLPAPPARPQPQYQQQQYQQPPPQQPLHQQPQYRQPTMQRPDFSARGAAALSSSVFAPPAVTPGAVFLVQVFAHLPEHEAQVAALAGEFDEAAKRRGIVRLESRVFKGERLAFELLLPGLLVDEPVQSMVWIESPQSVQFEVTVPSYLPPRTVIGTVTISRESVPIGHLKFEVSVHEPGAMVTQSAPTQGMHHYRRAFISYATADRREVLKRTQMLAGVGIEFFQDILTLEPGERWERRLYNEIDRCDLFLLFWSSAAKKSPWVLKEVHYALMRHGGNELAPPEILPVIIEGPPPVQPPSELAHLHFNDRMVYFMEPRRNDRWWHLWRRRSTVAN